MYKYKSNNRPSGFWIKNSLYDMNHKLVENFEISDCGYYILTDKLLSIWTMLSLELTQIEPIFDVDISVIWNELVLDSLDIEDIKMYLDPKNEEMFREDFDNSLRRLKLNRIMDNKAKDKLFLKLKTTLKEKVENI